MDTTTPETRSDPRRASGLEALNCAVLYGGCSSEREVSLTSAHEIVRALREPRDENDRRGPAGVLEVEIDQHGKWLVEGEALAPALALARLGAADVFLLALHGGDGEDGTLQGLLAASQRVFTGSGVAASAVAMDKVFAREVVSARGVRVAAGLAVSRERWQRESATVTRELEAWRGRDPHGWVIKPRNGGSSVGTSLVHGSEEFPEAFEGALAWGAEVLAEACIEGVEVAAGVVEEPDGTLLALPPVEIRPRTGGFFDYSEKYSESGAEELCPPENVDEKTCARVGAIALEAHRALRCSGYSRTDLIVPTDGTEPVFLETNTLPGMTPRSLLPRAAAAAGIDFRTLCLWIAGAALREERS